MNRTTPHRIIHVITRLDYGGSAKNTMLTALGHTKDDFVPMVVAGRPGRWDAQGGDAATEDNCLHLTRAGIQWILLSRLVRPVRPLADLLSLWSLIRIVHREKPALVHTHTSKAGVLGRIAAWVTGVPAVVHTPHGHVFYGHFGPSVTSLFLQIERLLSRITHRMVALTESERAEHLERGVGAAGQFAVVPSGIDLHRFRHVAAAPKMRPVTFACPPDALVVGSVGWLTEIKGHRFLIEAVAELAADLPELHLVIVGSGDSKGELEQLAGSLGLRKRVHLIGHREDVELCLAGMDLFVLPSLNEGMGRALIEAMAAGLPAIATRVGGVPALIEDGRTGLLVPPADSHALARAIRDLAEDPARRRSLGEAGQASVTDRFSHVAMVCALERLYRDLLVEVGAW